jgi:hypothetical protein
LTRYDLNKGVDMGLLIKLIGGVKEFSANQKQEPSRQAGLGSLAIFPNEILTQIFEEAIFSQDEKKEIETQNKKNTFIYPRPGLKIDDRTRIALLTTSKISNALVLTTPSQHSFTSKFSLGLIYGSLNGSRKDLFLQERINVSGIRKSHLDSLLHYANLKDISHAVNSIAEDKIANSLPSTKELQLYWTDRRYREGSIDVLDRASCDRFSKHLAMGAQLTSLTLYLSLVDVRSMTKTINFDEMISSARSIGDAIGALPELKALRWYVKDEPKYVLFHLEAFARATKATRLETLELHFYVDPLPVYPLLYHRWEIPHLNLLPQLTTFWVRSMEYLDAVEETGQYFPTNRFSQEIERFIKDSPKLTVVQLDLYRDED